MKSQKKKVIAVYVCLSVCAFLTACGKPETEDLLLTPMEISQETPALEAEAEPSAEPKEEPEAEPKPESEAEPKAEPEAEPKSEPEPSESVSGEIELVESGSFTLSKCLTYACDDGSQVAVSTNIEEEKELVRILYTNSTEFLICTSADGGITAEYTEASADNLKVGKSVNLEGSYEGADFKAEKIIIYNFL